MTSARIGDWAQTFTGKAFYALDPRPGDVCIDDIAHALAHICRFGGHCRTFYSVAQHSIMVSLLVPPEDAMWGLLHDAAEAYVGDMIRPLKRDMPAFQHAEKNVLAAIADRFSLPMVIPHSVHLADEKMLATEARDLMGVYPADWHLDAEPMEEQIVPVDPFTARRLFLNRFFKLKWER